VPKGDGAPPALSSQGPGKTPGHTGSCSSREHAGRSSADRERLFFSSCAKSEQAPLLMLRQGPSIWRDLGRSCGCNLQETSWILRSLLVGRLGLFPPTFCSVSFHRFPFSSTCSSRLSHGKKISRTSHPRNSKGLPTMEDRPHKKRVSTSPSPPATFPPWLHSALTLAAAGEGPGDQASRREPRRSSLL
jgi:hypothetical protein